MKNMKIKQRMNKKMIIGMNGYLLRIVKKLLKLNKNKSFKNLKKRNKKVEELKLFIEINSYL